MSDSEDSDSDQEYDEESEVQLGFIEHNVPMLFRDKNWRKWDGGKVGGKPIWLNPLALPNAEELSCSFCNVPLTFLLQIYCPLDSDDGTNYVDAFHRALYVFSCRNAACVNKSSVKCFRSQLPKKNDWYEESLPLSGEVVVKDDTSSNNSPPPYTLCAHCGCRGHLACSQCKDVYYCSKMHQKYHWTYGNHKVLCKGAAPAEDTDNKPAKVAPSKACLFNEYEIVVTDEVLESGEDIAAAEDIMSKANIWDGAYTGMSEPGKETSTETSTVPSGDADTAVAAANPNVDPNAPTAAEEEEDNKLRQRDFTKTLGNEAVDKVYRQFLQRVRRGGEDQILRYNSRWIDFDDSEDAAGRDVLLLSSSSLNADGSSTNNKVPACEHCGANRKMEFQIMPQLLHYLNVDADTNMVALPQRQGEQGSEQNQASTVSPTPSTTPFSNKTHEDIEWGTLDIYTCTGSCSKRLCDSTYQEYVLRQPPVSTTGKHVLKA